MFGSKSISKSISYNTVVFAILIALSMTSAHAATPDSYEDDDAIEQATVIDVSLTWEEVQSHGIHDNQDEDWFQFSLLLRQSLFISTYNLGAKADTALEFFKSDGSPVLLDGQPLVIDNNGYGSNPLGERFSFWPGQYNLNGGTFYLRVSSSPTSTINHDFGDEATYDIEFIGAPAGVGELPTAYLAIQIVDAKTGVPIDDATIRLTQDSLVFYPDSVTNGEYYFGQPWSYLYILSIDSLEGYEEYPDRLIRTDDNPYFGTILALTPTPSSSNDSIDVSPKSWHFDNILTKQYSEQVFTVLNTGTETLTGSTSGISPPFSIIGNTGYSLSPDESTTVTIRYSPTTIRGDENLNLAMFAGGGGWAVPLSGNLYDIGSVHSDAWFLRDFAIFFDADLAGCVVADGIPLFWESFRFLYPEGDECWSIPELLEMVLGENRFLDTIFVDFEAETREYSLDETGTSPANAFNRLTEAWFSVAPDRESVIHIEPGETLERFVGPYVLNPAHKVTLRANNGPVRIGVAGAVELP